MIKEYRLSLALVTGRYVVQGSEYLYNIHYVSGYIYHVFLMGWILINYFNCQIGIIYLDIKALWNTVILDGSIPQGEIERMIDNSFIPVTIQSAETRILIGNGYNLVVSKMTKKDQQSIVLGL